MSSRGMSSGWEMRRGRGEEWEWGIRISEESALNTGRYLLPVTRKYIRYLWKQLDGAKETNSQIAAELCS